MTTVISRCELPTSALLQRYLHNGAYTDCYVTQIAARVGLPEYVEAFYTTGVFKLERRILTWLVSKPSTDTDAKHLACGQSESFAAWSVEARAADQLLLCDFKRRTRSWLMVTPVTSDGMGTRLYFGSAVVPARHKSGAARFSFAFYALLGFHKLYSRMLLRAARSRLLFASGSRRS